MLLQIRVSVSTMQSYPNFSLRNALLKHRTIELYFFFLVFKTRLFTVAYETSGFQKSFKVLQSQTILKTK